MFTHLRGLALVLTLVVAARSSAVAPEPNDHKPWPSVEELLEDHNVAETAELRRLLWMTPLGLLMNDYLFEKGDPAANTARAHRITRRLLSSGPMLTGRLSAVQLMREDLYENGRVDSVVQSRLSQLDSEIAFKLHALQDRMTGNYVWHLVVPVAIGILAGSRPVIEQSRALVNAGLKKFGRYYSEEWANALVHSRQELQGKFGRGRFLRHYSPLYAWSAYSAAGAAYWTAYSFVQSGTGEDESLVRHFVNYSLQLGTSIEYL